MKSIGLAATVACLVVIGSVWAAWPEPARDHVWRFQKLRTADNRLLHDDALGFVAAKRDEGFELHVAYSGGTSFVIRCKGVPVMDVENTPSHVLIRMPADAVWRAPDIERLRIRFERWLFVQQSEGRLLVERAGPSWVEARLGRSSAAVPDGQRCLPEAPEQ